MNESMKVIIIAGLPFAVIAALFVFLLTYREYSHHYSDSKMPMKHSIEAAFFALVFFLILLVILGLVLSSMFR